MRSQFKKESRVLRTLAHPGRLAILAALRTEPACVCHLTVALGRPQAYLSQQLAILRDAGLIDGRREGQFVYYHIRDFSVLGIVDLAGRVAGTHPRPASAPASASRARLGACECPRCTRTATAPAGRTPGRTPGGSR